MSLEENLIFLTEILMEVQHGTEFLGHTHTPHNFHQVQSQIPMMILE